MGETPHEYVTEESIVYDAIDNSKGSVLVVDDSKMSRNLLKTLLEDEGYSVIAEAGDGEQALAAYKQYKPDLVTLDITMPKMDGIEALQLILKADSSAKVIMITAAGQQSKLIKALKYGAKKFITKPFEKEEVIANVNEVMDK
ncbi:MAG: response regulator [Clostridia bacterium]|nr:response regulator [Clostridia bacterium]